MKVDIFTDGACSPNPGLGGWQRRRKSKPPGVATLRTKKLIPFGWYGGKFSHLDWLLPLLPSCHHYCEPYAGSAAVLLNRKPAPIETYNDQCDLMAAEALPSDSIIAELSRGGVRYTG